MRLLLALFRLLILALSTATISMTLSKAKVFAPFRNYVLDHWQWGGELLTCPYCTSHWVALALVLITRTDLFDSPAHWGWFFSAMAIVASAAPFAGLIHRAYSTMPPSK